MATISNLDILEKYWNEIFIDFLNQMEAIFPDSPATSLKLQMKIQGTLNIGKKPIVLFLESVKGHEDEIVNKNDKYFFSEHSNVDFVEKMNLKKYYLLSSDHNKSIIWDFIEKLYIIASNYILNSN